MIRRALLVLAAAGLYIWVRRSKSHLAGSSVAGSRPTSPGTAAGQGEDAIAATGSGIDAAVTG